MGSQREPIRDPDQPGVVPFDVVHLRDFRRGMSEQVRDLFRREAEERPVRLFDSVYKFRAECVSEAMESLLLDPGVLQDLVNEPEKSGSEDDSGPRNEMTSASVQPTGLKLRINELAIFCRSI